MKPSDLEPKNPEITRVSLFEMPLDIGIDSEGVLARFDTDHFLLSYLNPFAYSIAKSSRNYASNLGRFDLVVCDGIGIQTAVEAVFKLTTPVISLDYSGIGDDYLQFGAKRKLSLCLVGGKEEVVVSAAAKIGREYPGFKNISTFCGYE